MSLDQLIEFIAQNFIFVAVVIGGLISMLGRMAGAGQQDQRGQRSQPPRHQQEEQVDWREIFKQEGAPLPEERSTPTKIEPASSVTFEESTLTRQQELQNQFEEMRRKREASSRKIKELRKEKQPSDSRKKEAFDLQLNQLSNKEAMKGVVWAEVLGRPRARQPHATFMKKR
jgi:hypothetical protein